MNIGTIGAAIALAFIGLFVFFGVRSGKIR